MIVDVSLKCRVELLKQVESLLRYVYDLGMARNRI